MPRTRRSAPRRAFAELRSAYYVVCLALACVGAGAAPLTLGGISVGGSILDVVKKLGYPTVVQSTDDGQYWQWSDRDGLDREVLTSDDLIVQSVLVAPVARSTGQPAEFRVLGADANTAYASMTAAGGAPMPRVWKNIHVWAMGGGYIVAETGPAPTPATATSPVLSATSAPTPGRAKPGCDDCDVVLRLRAVDVQTAVSRGYVGGRPTSPEHTAPTLVKAYVPPFVPPGQGTVIVRVALDASGRPNDVSVIVSSGDGGVDRFEVDSMRWSKFTPATCAGVPCPSVYLDIGGVMRER